jgi:hypothetical protein
LSVHGRFLRCEVFLLKNGAILRNPAQIRNGSLPSIRYGAQAGENARKKSFLNYESPALTAELQALLPMKTRHKLLSTRDRH